MSFNGLDENSPTIKQPKGLKIKLKEHQLTSIAAMRELESQGSIIIDKPDVASGLYHTVKYKLRDVDEFTDSTFVVETNSAILADRTGAGKTYSLIGLILNTMVPDSHNRFVLGTDHFSVKMISTKNCEAVNLIVVPHNLANQWSDFLDKSSLSYLKLNTIADFDVFFKKDYVTKQTPLPNGFVIYKKSKKKKIPLEEITDLKEGGSKSKKKRKPKNVYERRILSTKRVNKILANTNVIVLNVNRYKFFKQIFRSNKWARVIIDEMDSANIPSMFDEFGNFNWFVTATPTSIFYKSCRRYVNKIFGYNQHLLQYFIVKNKDEYVDASMVLPKPHVFVIETLLQKVVSVIKDLIPQDVLQLINAGNMKEAISKLNCDVDTEENIVKVLTDKIRMELDNLVIELDATKKQNWPDKPAQNKKIEKLEHEINRCKTRLKMVNDRINSIKDECCFICAEEFDTPAILDCCKSVFCLKCLLSALKMAENKCPYCRHVLKSNKEYHIISDKSIKKKKSVEKKKNLKQFTDMDKSDVLEKILMYISDNEETPRILIFSDYSQTFDKIIKNIAKAKLQYERISGIPQHITNVINEFNAGTTNILLLDSQHYGSGLNLQAADYLILYHRMTPELETQVIGRANRFGRKNPLIIIYLVNDSEIKITKLSANPFGIEDESELWMLTNPPENDKEDENIDSGDEKKSNDDEDEKGSEDEIEEDSPKKIKKSKKKSSSKTQRKSKRSTKSKSKRSRRKVIEV